MKLACRHIGLVREQFLRTAVGDDEDSKSRYSPVELYDTWRDGVTSLKCFEAAIDVFVNSQKQQNQDDYRNVLIAAE